MPTLTNTADSNTASLASQGLAIARDLGALARNHLELALLEGQHAAITLAKILSAAVVVSILVVTAWLALVSSVLVWATDAGLGWPLALGIAAAANLGLAGAAIIWIRSQLGELIFAATLRQLRRTANEIKDEIT